MANVKLSALPDATSLALTDKVPSTQSGPVTKNLSLTQIKALLALTAFNVKSYGAVGDGSTDDTAAIQSCINAAIAAGNTDSNVVGAGGSIPVYFPTGTYKISDQLTFSGKSIHFFGDGPRASQIRQVTSDKNAFNCTETANLTDYSSFRDLCIYTTVGTGGTGVGIEMALSSGTNDGWIIENCIISGFKTGLHAWGLSNFIGFNTEFTNCQISVFSDNSSGAINNSNQLIQCAMTPGATAWTGVYGLKSTGGGWRIAGGDFHQGLYIDSSEVMMEGPRWCESREQKDGWIILKGSAFVQLRNMIIADFGTPALNTHYYPIQIDGGTLLLDRVTLSYTGPSGGTIKITSTGRCTAIGETRYIIDYFSSGVYSYSEATLNRHIQLHGNSSTQDLRLDSSGYQGLLYSIYPSTITTAFAWRLSGGYFSVNDVLDLWYSANSLTPDPDTNIMHYRADTHSWHFNWNQVRGAGQPDGVDSNNFYPQASGAVAVYIQGLVDGMNLKIGDRSNSNLRLSGVLSSASYNLAGGSGDKSSFITATTDLTFGAGTVGKFVDGVYTRTDFFFNVQTVSGHYIKFDFGRSLIITEAKYYQQDTTAQGTFKWQGSNDNSTWTDIGTTFTLGGAATQTQTQLNGNTTAYRYYRLLGTAGSTSNGPYIYQFDFKINFSSAALEPAIQSYVGAAWGRNLLLQPNGGKVFVGQSMGSASLNVDGSIATGKGNPSGNALTQITSSSPTFTFTNTFGKNIFVFLDVTSITALTLNGQTLPATLPFIPMSPNDVLVVTSTLAPAMYRKDA